MNSHFPVKPDWNDSVFDRLTNSSFYFSPCDFFSWGISSSDSSVPPSWHQSTLQLAFRQLLFNARFCTLILFNVYCPKPCLTDAFWHNWPAFASKTSPEVASYYSVRDDKIQRHQKSLSKLSIGCMRRGGRLIPLSHERIRKWSFEEGEERQGQRWYSDTWFSFQTVLCFLYVMLTLLFDTSGNVDIFITSI